MSLIFRLPRPRFAKRHRRIPEVAALKRQRFAACRSPAAGGGRPEGNARPHSMAWRLLVILHDV
jgi:hypothetical protein